LWDASKDTNGSDTRVKDSIPDGQDGEDGDDGDADDAVDSCVALSSSSDKQEWDNTAIVVS